MTGSRPTKPAKSTRYNHKTLNFKRLSPKWKNVKSRNKPLLTMNCLLKCGWKTNFTALNLNKLMRTTCFWCVLAFVELPQIETFLIAEFSECRRFTSKASSRRVRSVHARGWSSFRRFRCQLSTAVSKSCWSARGRQTTSCATATLPRNCWTCSLWWRINWFILLVPRFWFLVRLIV